MVSHGNNWERVKNEGTDKSCPKPHFFKLPWYFLRLEEVRLVRKDVEADALMCQGQTGKISRVSPDKMTIFPHLALFSCLSLPNIYFEITFLKSTRIELSSCKVLFWQLKMCGF